MKRTIHILLVALAAIVGSAPAIMAEPAVEKAVTEKLEDTVEAAEKEKPDLKETISSIWAMATVGRYLSTIISVCLFR